MNVQNISFGLIYKKQYSLQTKEGKPISKEEADNVVKRNMTITTAVIMPSILTGVALIFSKTKKSVINALAFGVGFAALSAYLLNDEYKYYKKEKEYQPERFYKWGRFKVIYDNETKS